MPVSHGIPSESFDSRLLFHSFSRERYEGWWLFFAGLVLIALVKRRIIDGCSERLGRYSQHLLSAAVIVLFVYVFADVRACIFWWAELLLLLLILVLLWEWLLTTTSSCFFCLDFSPLTVVSLFFCLFVSILPYFSFFTCFLLFAYSFVVLYLPDSRVVQLPARLFISSFLISVCLSTQPMDDRKACLTALSLPHPCMPDQSPPPPEPPCFGASVWGSPSTAALLDPCLIDWLIDWWIDLPSFILNLLLLPLLMRRFSFLEYAYCWSVHHFSLQPVVLILTCFACCSSSFVCWASRCLLDWWMAFAAAATAVDFCLFALSLLAHGLGQ